MHGLLTGLVFVTLIFFADRTIKTPDVIGYPIPQGCAIYAMAMQSSVNARAVLDDRCYWSDILAFKAKDADIYHCILVYEYDSSTWVYDCNLGSFKIASNKIWNKEKILSLAYDDLEIEDSFWIRTELDHHDNVIDE